MMKSAANLTFDRARVLRYWGGVYILGGSEDSGWGDKCLMMAWGVLRSQGFCSRGRVWCEVESAIYVLMARRLHSSFRW